MLINAQTKMGELQDYFPGISLFLWSRYRIGSRDQYGYGSQESLEEVLRAHHLFDVESCLASIKQEYREQLSLIASPQDEEEIRELLETHLWVDVRERELYDLWHPLGARFLDRDLDRLLAGLDKPLLFYDRQGLVSPAAARLYRKRYQVESFFLLGGLERLAKTFPLAYPRVLSRAYHQSCEERTTFWLLHRSPLTLGLLRKGGSKDRVFSQLDPSCRWSQWGERFGLKIGWLSEDERGVRLQFHPKEGARFSEALEELWKEDFRQWDLAGREAELDWSRIQRELEEEHLVQVSEQLKVHDGKVKLESFERGSLALLLEGGCKGCSAAEPTVYREIAGALFSRVPELKEVKDVTYHQVTALTHQGSRPLEIELGAADRHLDLG